VSKRSLLLAAGSVLALLIGLVALVAGFIGFQSPLNSADGLTAWPNLLTGAASIVAAAGFWSLKKWSEAVYLLVFVGHVVTQILLYFGRAATGRAVPSMTIAFLAVVPLISLAILADMEYHRRKGALS
jgi:hypothetical protein